MKKIRPAPPGASSVGTFLKDIRRARGMSLRDVERASDGGVSNAYLSQLENGVIANPSASMLNKIAETYALNYDTLLNRGGIGATTARTDSRTTEAATPRTRELFGDLTLEEERQLLQYLAFLRS